MPRVRTLHTAHPEQTARAADLRYIGRAMAGIERLGKRNFRYRFQKRPVTDTDILERIRKLAIPPAWTRVWICPYANGHLQATGVDAKGRKQYRYHADWSALRSLTKYDHTRKFGAQLPVMRKRIAADLSRPGLPLEKVLAMVVSIMDQTLIRIGHEAYARENGSYGLSTLLDRHVKAEGGQVRFVFTGKTGIGHNIKLSSRRLSALVMRCRELPGQDLFQYLDEHDEAQPINSDLVNGYIRTITNGRFTSKDIRTWKGTVHCVRALLRGGPLHAKGELASRVNAALDSVAGALGNTRAVCRKYYVHPKVLEAFEQNTLHAEAPLMKATRSMGLEEGLLLRVLGGSRGRRAQVHRKKAA